MIRLLGWLWLWQRVGWLRPVVLLVLLWSVLLPLLVVALGVAEFLRGLPAR